jgi:predicted nucleic acid-binding protein
VSGSVVVDTSLFIDFLRSNGGYSLLDELFTDDYVLLSEVVRLELLAGVRKPERFRLSKVLLPLRRRDRFPGVQLCDELINRARGSGLYGGIPDVMILADALEEGAAVASKDLQLLRLADLVGVPVVDVR